MQESHQLLMQSTIPIYILLGDIGSLCYWLSKYYDIIFVSLNEYNKEYNEL